MPRKKKEMDVVDVKIPAENMPVQAPIDIEELVASLLQPGDEKKTMEIDGKEISLVDFVMYVENILRKASRTLTGVEYQILTVFMAIMQKHALLVGREVYDRWKAKGGGSNDDTRGNQ